MVNSLIGKDIIVGRKKNKNRKIIKELFEMGKIEKEYLMMLWNKT